MMRFLTLAVLILTFSIGCSSPTVKPNFQPETYTLQVDASANTQKPAYVSFSKVVLGGRTLDMRSARRKELEAATVDFANLLKESNLFKTVEVVDKHHDGLDGYLITISCLDTVDWHIGGSMAGGFLSGFFTLGAAPVTTKYSYSSAMTIDVSKKNKIVLSNTSTKAGDASGSHFQGEFRPEVRDLRKIITEENKKASVQFLVKNIDKLK